MFPIEIGKVYKLRNSVKGYSFNKTQFGIDMRRITLHKGQLVRVNDISKYTGIGITSNLDNTIEIQARIIEDKEIKEILELNEDLGLSP